MEKQLFTVFYDTDTENYIVTIPDVPICSGRGDSLIASLFDAVSKLKRHKKELDTKGLPLPLVIQLMEKNFKYI